MTDSLSTAISQKADVMDAVIAVSFKQMEDGVFTDATAPRITGNGWQKLRIVLRRLSMSVIINRKHKFRDKHLIDAEEE